MKSLKRVVREPGVTLVTNCVFGALNEIKAFFAGEEGWYEHILTTMAPLSSTEKVFYA